MKVLSKEKFKVLAEERGWSLSRAEGFVDGESYRRRGKRPPKYVLVCLDDYSQGFRAGYFERQNLDAAFVREAFHSKPCFCSRRYIALRLSPSDLAA